jgi:hypothetical protein
LRTPKGILASWDDLNWYWSLAVTDPFLRDILFSFLKSRGSCLVEFDFLCSCHLLTTTSLVDLS